MVERQATRRVGQPGAAAPTAGRGRRLPRVVIYSTSGCSYCRQAKAFLQRNRIAFTECDLERNRRAQSEFRRSGGQGVPMIMVGKQRIDGFDPQRLRNRLRAFDFDV